MVRRADGILRAFDFSGGLVTNAPVTSLKLNEALDLQNINLIGDVGNCGFEKRRGNTVFNSSAMASGAAVHGLGYYRQADLDEWLVTVCGDKIFKSEFDGTMDDITGAVTISAGQDNIWTTFDFNNVHLGFGGAPDTPWVWTGAGNASALGGTPPSGSFGLTANNRVFAGGASATPSRIAWSVLGNHADWTGSGSGNQDVSLNDGDSLVGGAQLGIDHLILFKQNSIHDLIIRTAPFPLFLIKRGKSVGAVSKKAIVSVGNLIYYVTPEPRLKATDGNNVYDSSNPGPTGLTDKIDDVWDALNKSRLKYTEMIYYPKEDQLIIMCSKDSSATHNYAIVWDIGHKCWLRHLTGFKMNTSTIAQDRVLYTGAYDGKIYKQDVASTYTDASESSPGTISAYWRSGWNDAENMLLGKVIPYVDLNFRTQTLGTFDFGYGFNFSADRKVESIDMSIPGAMYGSAVYGVDIYGGQSDTPKLIHLKGYGKYFQFLLRNQNPSQAFQFNGMEFPVKAASVEAFR